LYVEEQIYERFPSKTDDFLLDQFHQTAWERRTELVERLSDGRLRELGFRLIYFERPDALCAEKRRELEVWHNQRLNPTCEVPWLTITDALSEAEKLRQEDSESRELLSSLLDWLRARSPPIRADNSNGHGGRGPPQRKTALGRRSDKCDWLENLRIKVVKIEQNPLCNYQPFASEMRIAPRRIHLERCHRSPAGSARPLSMAMGWLSCDRESRAK
jgi:hypothetical protein